MNVVVSKPELLEGVSKKCRTIDRFIRPGIGLCPQKLLG